MQLDSTRLRDQPALTTSSGRIWLLVGGLFAGFALIVLIPMALVLDAGAAKFGAIAVGVLYLAMIVVRLAVPGGRLRLGLLAIGLLSVAAVSLVCAGIVAASVWIAPV